MEVFIILNILKSLGYKTTWSILNSKNFGVAQERKRIYKKLRKLGFHTLSNKRSISLHRWKNAKMKRKELKGEKTIIHDVVNIYLDKNDDIYLVIYSIAMWMTFSIFLA